MFGLLGRLKNRLAATGEKGLMLAFPSVPDDLVAQCEAAMIRRGAPVASAAVAAAMFHDQLADDDLVYEYLEAWA